MKLHLYLCDAVLPPPPLTPPHPKLIWYPSPVGMGGWWGGDNSSSNIACNTVEDTAICQ